jgi:hypothetical protein
MCNSKVRLGFDAFNRHRLYNIPSMGGVGGNFILRLVG